MVQLQRNFSLVRYNTFGINVTAKLFAKVQSVEEIKQAIEQAKTSKILILSGGSNVLFTKDFEGLVIQPIFENIKKTNEDEHYVYLKVGAGVEWDSFVEYCVKNQLGGVENLSLIPGWVGACPIQNIGAYGVEVKDVITNVLFLDITEFKIANFNNESCKFAYRDSIFKRKLRNKGIITHVEFRLKKTPRFVLKYGDLENKVKAIGEINLENIRKAVIVIREQKLPDTNELGNAGSFFKNPEIEPGDFDHLKQKYPAIPGYNLQSGKIKIPAAWLIEQAGFKGKRVGNCGTHIHQPLVIVNYGGASGGEIVTFSESIKKKIKELFGIELYTEVNLV